MHENVPNGWHNTYKRVGEGIKWEYVINPISMEKTVRAQSEHVCGMSEKPTMAARRIVLPIGILG